jgi:hypothetical protein
VAGSAREPLTAIPRLVGGQPLSFKGLTPAQIDACRAIADRPGHVHFTAHPDRLALAESVLVHWREGECRCSAAATPDDHIQDQRVAPA